MKTVSIKWGGGMNANQVHPSGLLTEEQVSALSDLKFTGVPSLIDYTGVFFAIMIEEDEVVAFPLEMLCGASEAFDRVLRVIKPHVDERVPEGGIAINVAVTIEGLGGVDYKVTIGEFWLWYVGRQLLIPQRALIEVQNHMRSSAHDLDERFIHWLLSVDYADLIQDSNPFIHVKL